jgi:hypothetical protein
MNCFRRYYSTVHRYIDNVLQIIVEKSFNIRNKTVKNTYNKILFCHLIKDLAEEVDGSLREAHFVTELHKNKELANRLHQGWEKTMRERKGQVAVCFNWPLRGGGRDLTRKQSFLSIEKPGEQNSALSCLH